jgi:hypothetical protein
MTERGTLKEECEKRLPVRHARAGDGAGRPCLETAGSGAADEWRGDHPFRKDLRSQGRNEPPGQGRQRIFVQFKYHFSLEKYYRFQGRVSKEARREVCVKYVYRVLRESLMETVLVLGRTGFS